MSTPTWGIYIPGYSSPSAAQKRKFERMYPGVASRFQEDMEAAHKRQAEERRQIVAEERKRQAACTHLFVPTNVDDNHVCRHCRMWVKSLAEVFADIA
jgi:hypothetical protein